MVESSAALRRIGAVLFLCMFAGCQFKNNPPDTPAAPTGPTQVITDSPAVYVYSATDPDGDSVYLGLGSSFGEYEYVEWSRLVGSGDIVSRQFGWGDSGTHRLRVRALDQHGYYSDWSPTLTVTVVRDTYGGRADVTQGSSTKEESR